MGDEWLSEKLSDLLLFPVPQDMIDYIKSITNMRDLEDYMNTLLDFENPHHKRFLQELILKRKGNSLGGYRKNEMEEDYIAPMVEKKKKEKNGKPQGVANGTAKKEISEQLGQSKKNKYVNLYSQEGRSRDIVLLKGRKKCDCEASKHRLINNCLNCGRIVCEQEGSGPCLFCSNLVCSRDEQIVLNRGSKRSSQLLQKLMDQKPEGYDAAIEQRNRLLEYDRTSEKRTCVIDDESDYFSTNSVWLSKAEREHLKKKEEEMHARKHQSRKDRVLSLDIGLRKMVEATPSEDGYDFDELDNVVQDICNSVKSLNTSIYGGDIVNPSVTIQPKFNDRVTNEFGRTYKMPSNWTTNSLTTKIQDREYLEMVDDGLCLSLHQPWASLLVCGIKLHEGRNWYTSHRGRLWIASTAKAPHHQEIKDMEDLYRTIKEDVVYPLTYPTGCLLGCLNVSDCLPQEEYRSRFPEGESDSPFVFICDSPHELPIRFPISGKHKIYKLDALIHQAAQKALERVAKIKSEQNSLPFIRNS